MVGNGREVQGFPPIGAPLNNYMQREEHWSHQGSDSVNAVSFGFVATAILISMFLVMAIFEKFLRPDSSPVLSPSVHGRSSLDLEAQGGFNGKLAYPSPKVINSLFVATYSHSILSLHKMPIQLQKCCFFLINYQMCFCSSL